jgi:murein DD-endopeptidase MepM/ murein hydrolase activator NlpD
LQNDIQVRIGQVVGINGIIGTMGNTGQSGGRHLHFDIWYNGVKGDPTKFIPALNNVPYMPVR